MNPAQIRPIRQRPGDGPPWLVRHIGGQVVRVIARKQPLATTLARAEELADEIEAEVNGMSDEFAVRRVLIHPMTMLEDSSRDWSAAMTVEHLSIVGEHVVDGLSRIRRREPAPPGCPVGTADVKPDEVDRAAALRRFRAMRAAWRSEVEQPEDPPGRRPRRRHPWFGPLDYRQWCFFEQIHRELHLRQIRRIRHVGGAACE